MAARLIMSGVAAPARKAACHAAGPRGGPELRIWNASFLHQVFGRNQDEVQAAASISSFLSSLVSVMLRPERPLDVVLHLVGQLVGVSAFSQ